MRKLVVALAAAAGLVVASPASAHFIVVTSPGTGQVTVNHHVGQWPPGHNSCFGLSTADSREQSAAVNFLGPLGPPAAACLP
jgi:hypothetical protein